MLSQHNILSVPTVILLEIGYFLDVESFLTLRLACKSLKKLTCSEEFFPVYLRKTPAFKLLNILPPLAEAETFYSQAYFLLSKPLDVKLVEPLDLKPIDASNSHNDQFIHATSPDTHGFWGSQGTADENKEEYLFYRFADEIAVPTQIYVEFTYFSYVHQGGIMIGNPVFPSKYVQIELSLVPEKPIYISPKYEVKDKVKDTVIKIPILPNLVAARYLKVKFIGMQSKHTLKDNLYYLCVDSVVSFGYNSEYNDKNGFGLGDFVIKSAKNFYTRQAEIELGLSPEKSCHSDKMTDESEDKLVSKALIESGYNIEAYNSAILEQVKACPDFKSVESLLNINLQLLEYPGFFEYLISKEELAVEYFEAKSKKHGYLEAIETKLLIELVYDFENNQLGKNSALLGLFEFYLLFKQDLAEITTRKVGIPDLLRNKIVEGFEDCEWMILGSWELKGMVRKMFESFKLHFAASQEESTKIKID